jgi:hypothetical protein
MTQVTSTSSDEIRGDWSNIKGTEYRLPYALWLLLRKHAGSVAFYKGNDLVAMPLIVSSSVPPRPSSELDDDDSLTVPAYRIRSCLSTFYSTARMSSRCAGQCSL